MPEAADRVGERQVGADPLRLFGWIAPLLFALYALLTPPLQTPDEHQHLFRAWQLASFDLIGERRGNASGGEIAPGLVRAAEAELGSAEPHLPFRSAPQSGWDERLSRATPVASGEPWPFANFLGSVSYSPAGYVPQVLGVWIGQALGLSVENIVRLGRLLNAALAFLLLRAAMQALPVGRLLLLVVALLPMTAACAGSLGQDGLVIGASAWLVALCLKAVIGGSWSWGSGRLAMVLTVLVTLSKMIYLPLVGLGLFLRRQSGGLRIALAPLLAGLAAAVLLGGWLALNAGLAVPMMVGMPSPGEQARFMIEHPASFPMALARTFDLGGLAILLGRLFQFGWLTVGPVMPAMLAFIIGLGIALWAGDARAGDLSRPWRLWSLAVCGGIVILLALAMFLAATPLGAERIEGLQGRYFIPLLLPVGLAFLRSRSQPQAGAARMVALAMVLANAASLTAIVQAFYA
ncbi:DUF2142 domain-containing protein [Novosphingobium sp. TH158]|uniref:DUF2142 domain-containing protein n=1 Tax=Novosphingobium sp. TH158 TaxID=2067455 RepID=UPI000C7A80CE|nr:DUF2142 domain-containing protein [Novosphingobium sp. TH158]PLK26865.1 hypothetical protein C0V78_08155 [Novosphingobium sp. TH158]